MDDYLLPGIIAATVAMLIWCAMPLIRKLFNSEQKRLKQRLTVDGQGPADLRQANLSITIAEDGNVPAFLARKAYIQKLRRNLGQAFPDMSLQWFFIAVGMFGVVPLLVGVFMGWAPLVLLLSAGGMGYIPFLVMGMRRNKRNRSITEQLPDAMDFLSRIMRAGHSLSTGFQMMSEELLPPLSTEFRRCYDQHSLGQPLEEGLREMTTRIESTDLSFFVTAVLIQRQTGGDLSEVLDNISGLVRQRLRLAQQVRAKTAEGRFTGYIMVAFPAVMFCICYALNPELYGLFFANSTGYTLLGTAIGLQTLGLVMIKKFTTVKV